MIPYEQWTHHIGKHESCKIEMGQRQKGPVFVKTRRRATNLTLKSHLIDVRAHTEAAYQIWRACDF